MSSTLDKAKAKAIVDSLPDDATWEDLMHELYMRERIEAGLADSSAGRITHVSDVRKKYAFR